jgi:type 1 fimbria pilin
MKVTDKYYQNDLTATYIIPLGGHYYIPHDLPIGSIIGVPTDAMQSVARSVEGYDPECYRKSDAPPYPQPIFESNLQATAPIYGGSVPSHEGHDLTGKVFFTGIEGVGIALKLFNPYAGLSSRSNFTPVGGNPFVPFRAIDNNTSSTYVVGIFSLAVMPVLVKIGNIAPGTHTFGPIQLIKGDMMPALPNAFTIAVSGALTVASCSLDSANPISDTPVKLGEWSTDHFTGPGTVTTAVPFHINLLNCVNNPIQGTPGTVPWGDESGFAVAHIRLDGRDGSTVVDKDLGLFTLATDSGASGVGIQMLRSDGVTPVALGEDVAITRLAPTGAMTLDFTARFYQLPGSPYVTAGSAKGALNFTLTYQ